MYAGGPHPGMVRAASFAMRSQSELPGGTLPRRAPFCSGSSASGRVCRWPPSVSASGPSATSLPSRSFQMSSSSLEGAVPISPAHQPRYALLLHRDGSQTAENWRRKGPCMMNTKLHDLASTRTRRWIPMMRILYVQMWTSNQQIPQFTAIFAWNI